MNICKQCNKEYSSVYTQNSGYTYTNLNTVFCSKKCATTYQRGSLSIDILEKEIIDFVISKNRYCTQEERHKGIKRSSKTLIKFKISIKNIQNNIGFTKSKSHFEEQVLSHLKKYFTDIECEKTFKNLLSPKGFNLRIDFYIKKFNLIIEADGRQHLDINNPWYKSYYANCDLLKNNYAKKHNINIIRIPYIRNVTDIYIKKYLSEFI